MVLRRFRRCSLFCFCVVALQVNVFPMASEAPFFPFHIHILVARSVMHYSLCHQLPSSLYPTSKISKNDILNLEKKMEGSVPPEQLPPHTSSPNENRPAKIHSTLPFRPYEERGRAQPIITNSPQNKSFSSEAPTSFSRTSPRSPLPSMNNSPKKILQLMGYDPRLDRPISIQRRNPEEGSPPSSSGSLYSTYAEGSRYSYANELDENELGSFTHHVKEQFQTPNQTQVPSSSEWPFSEDEEKPTIAIAEERRLGSDIARSSGQRGSKLLERTNSDELATLNEMLYEELQRDVQYPVSSKYRNVIADTQITRVTPLTPPISWVSGVKGRTKPKPIALELPKKPSYTANNKIEGSAWGSEHKLCGDFRERDNC